MNSFRPSNLKVYQKSFHMVKLYLQLVHYGLRYWAASICSRSGSSGQKVLIATCDWLNERKIQRYNFPLYFINTTQKEREILSSVLCQASPPKMLLGWLPNWHWLLSNDKTSLTTWFILLENKGTKFLFSENPRHKYRQVWLQDVVLKIHTVHSYKGSKLIKCDLWPRTTLTVCTSQILPKV